MIEIIAKACYSGTWYELAAFADQGLTRPYDGRTRGYLGMRIEGSDGAWESDPLSGSASFWRRVARRIRESLLISDRVVYADELKAAMDVLDTEEKAREAENQAEREKEAKRAERRAALHEWVKMRLPHLHGKGETIRLTVPGDSEKPSVKATVYADTWAVHLTLGHANGVYTVTHVPTGLAASRSVTKTEAQWIVTRLLVEAPEWGMGLGMPAKDSTARRRAALICHKPYEPIEERV